MRKLAIVLVVLSLSATAFAQLTTPPNGDNQKASVTQHIGLVQVTIVYNSPKVHHPRTNEDRRGKIWGTLVPWGAPDDPFGTCTVCPWRAGANENTVFAVSHDVKVEGQPLPAGRYGLFMIPAQNEDWTVIFSKNSTSWGSYYYDPAEDALRVKVKPVKTDYHEYLTYDFTERKTDGATVALKWEELAVPIRITVDNMNELYLAALRNDMRTNTGFNWTNIVAAAQWAIQNKVGLKDALQWANTAANDPFLGNENFQTLSTLAQAQEANGMAEESKKTMERAVNHRSTGPTQIHQYARQLQTQGKKEEAWAVYQLNAKRHGSEWPVNVGLARGHSMMGRYKEALKHAKLALAQAPDDVNRNSLKTAIAKLEQGKDMN